MHVFRRKGILALAAAGCLIVTGAAAQDTTPLTGVDHEVIIVDGAYFPPLVYATIGDRLVFINESSDVHVVEGPEETWTSGSIPVEGTFTLVLDDETPLLFRASAETEGTSEEEGDVVLEQVGEITYEPAPVDG